MIYYNQERRTLMSKFTLPKAKCERCGHGWTPRQREIKVCPKCKSPYWDRKRIKK